MRGETFSSRPCTPTQGVQAPVEAKTDVHTAATTPSAGSPSINHATGVIHHTGGDPTTPRIGVDDLRRQVEEMTQKSLH
jgi:hypothetical protein